MEHHVHCVSCFNHRCTVKPEPGVSCDLITCPLVCGAVFHSCKIDEHQLLCPLVRVPCLNSGYGCPTTLTRNQMYAHLDLCPAGVVCCTMEWNRWPISCMDFTSYESLSRVVEEVEQLDMALALQDQRTLLESLKVITMAPSTQEEPLAPVCKENRAKNISGQLPSLPSSLQPSQVAPAVAGKEKILSGINGLNEEHFSKLYEATVETARSLAAALDFVTSVSCNDNHVEGGNIGDNFLKSSLSDKVDLKNCLEEDDTLHRDHTKAQNCSLSCLNKAVAYVERDNTTDGSLSGATESSMETVEMLEIRGDVETENSASGPFSVAQGQCAVSPEVLVTIDDVSQDHVSPQMLFPVHVSPGVAQSANHVILEDNGHERRLHQSKIRWVQSKYSSSNGPIGRSSYRLRAKMEDKAVDTSDLEQEDDPMGLGEIDLITAALLFCLEESRECRRISDTVYVDGYRVDFGTQTFTFPATILVTNTRVGDMASASACDHAAPQLTYPSPFRTLRLGLVLEALEPEVVPYNRYLPSNTRCQHTFPFICSQSFRRDQFSSHFKNVHGDIHAGLNGWMEHRCPLAYYGCTFSQRRFYPSTQGAKVVHDRHLKSFGVQLHPGAGLETSSHCDHFSGLPIEILWHIARFLDSFSLCQLSLVSRTMREVCASLLQTRGIVELQWERRHCPDGPGTVSWHVKNKVWRFSTAFSPVSSWGFTDTPSMSVHLKKCHFNVAEQKTEPVPLPAMCTARDGFSLRRVLRHVNA